MEIGVQVAIGRDLDTPNRPHSAISQGRTPDLNWYIVQLHRSDCKKYAKTLAGAKQTREPLAVVGCAAHHTPRGTPWVTRGWWFRRDLKSGTRIVRRGS